MNRLTWILSIIALFSLCMIIWIAISHRLEWIELNYHLLFDLLCRFPIQQFLPLGFPFRGALGLRFKRFSIHQPSNPFVDWMLIISIAFLFLLLLLLILIIVVVIVIVGIVVVGNRGSSSSSRSIAFFAMAFVDLCKYLSTIEEEEEEVRIKLESIRYIYIYIDLDTMYTIQNNIHIVISVYQ